MSDWRFDLLGDSAVSVRVGDDPSLATNARVHRLARALRRASVAGIRDVVPGMCELVVHVDPLRCEIRQVESVVRAAMGAPDDQREARPSLDRDDDVVVEIPVTYGGAGGPDLEHVAAACGLDVEEVCRRHAAVEYVVCFIGFLPGFPYLGLLDTSLRLPRRTTPRTRVPAGSVAIAGEYTGIYPAASPGGWHLIGRTDVTLFDAGADRPARLAPGVRVRFVPRSDRVAGAA
jgi:KipI family sensor histidine kinase inhibitor